MREPHDIIISPVVTEKTAEQMESRTSTRSSSSDDANKIEIGQAVEKLWDVTVKDVRTMRYAGKARRSLHGPHGQELEQGPPSVLQEGGGAARRR